MQIISRIKLALAVLFDALTPKAPEDNQATSITDEEHRQLLWMYDHQGQPWNMNRGRKRVVRALEYKGMLDIKAASLRGAGWESTCSITKHGLEYISFHRRGYIGEDMQTDLEQINEASEYLAKACGLTKLIDEKDQEKEQDHD